ncbi:hypothetical protein [Elstera sp.]|jgi:hypothetical protein|uniref:hypothetical protein n=1 Tax=Elstera sp. TaxID=1916664 RepID=UPI0037BE22EB
MSEIDERAFQLRTVTQLIERANGGDDFDGLNKEMNEVVESLQTQICDHHVDTAKGSLTITIDFTADRKGLDVKISSKTKKPNRPSTKDRFFITDDNRISLRDPARGTMFEGANLGRRNSN